MTPLGEEKPPRRVNPLRRTVMKKYVVADCWSPAS
jgi:hypothetical protein